MDKYSLVSSFQKSIEALKNTECSPKEKLAHFANISQFITLPSMQNHPNQIKFISNSLAVLLMFCEEMDSTVHLNAEENLNKIIRFCEKNFIVRIQYDLYHEIKKNGNERSLRICLNIFGYYCHLIKQRKVKPYANNFLPCIYAISQREETQLIETLCEFLKTFCKFVEKSLADREILKLIEIFLNDTTSDCAIKRRCASQNVMTLIINSTKPDFICRHAFNRSIDLLTSDQTINTVIGILGMLRLFMPQLTCDKNCDFNKIIQILDVCLQLLHDKSHSIINASLEVIHAILRTPQKILWKLLTSTSHIDIIRNDSSLRNLVFKNSGSKTTLSKFSEIDRHDFEMSSRIFSKDIQILDESSILCTDIEMDSLKSIDSSQEIENVIKTSDTTSLKSQKSTESFGSFFNSLLSQSKPSETVSKFFRSQGSSLNNTPEKAHIDDNSSLNDFAEDDRVSVESFGSNVSINSNDSPLVVPTNETDEIVTVVEKQPQPSLSNLSLNVGSTTEACKLDELTESMKFKEISIGSIYDQYLIEYIVRFVCYKFLLAGQDQKLKIDNVVRVSIKNVSLLVLSDCVRIYPQILLMKLTAPQKENVLCDVREKVFDEISELCLEKKVQIKDDLLDIKPDHFGKSSCSLVEFLSPLIESGGKKLTNNTELVANSFVNESIDMGHETSDQSVEDILLYFNHLDPSLRGNIQSIIGNFIVAVMENYQDINKFCETFSTGVDNKFINLNLLLKVLIKGLSDEIHTVVKRSLASIDLVLPLIFSTLLELKQKRQDFDSVSFLSSWKFNDLNVVPKEPLQIEQILDELLIAGSNKNWVVQSKYCELVTNINWKQIRLIMTDDLGCYYENKFLESIYSLIGDQDSRTRSKAIQCLCHYIEQEKQHQDNCNENVAIGNIVCSRLFDGLPMPFKSFKIEHYEISKCLQMKLGKVLYTLSNKLLELSDRNQQFGIISAISAIVTVFNPIRYHFIWNEFNILDVCLNFMQENFSIGTDASCQCDLLNICTSFLAGNIFDLKYKNVTQINTLLQHVLKLLNVLNHVFNNIRPIYIPKGQKNDIFISTKEFQIFESFGYFGNNYFYRRIYKLLQQSFESYKISINNDCGQIIMDLLTTTLNSFIVILEIKIPEQNPSSIKLIEEALSYLSTLINYAPKESVIVIRQLLKYMFATNLISRTSHFEYLATNLIQNGRFECDENKLTIILRNLSELPDTSSDQSAHILLFNPIVIRCLKMFSKSDTSVQSAILDMVCQALEFNVNYSLLDANNVFLDFVLKLSELIETGTIRESEVVVPSIVKFLFSLTKEKDRKLITIPKIINITDTLLANDVESGAQALNELAFKFFFENTTCDGADFSIKDINTQKEVALRMLIKFLHIKEIQNSLSMILMLQRASTSENENSFYVNLLQVIEDNPEIFSDSQQFPCIQFCFKILRTATVMEATNLRKVFSIFYNRIATKNEDSVAAISVILILIDYVITNMTEENALKETKQYLEESTTIQTSDAVLFFTDSIFQFIQFVIEHCSYMDIHVGGEKHISKMGRMLFTNKFGLSNFHTIKQRLSTEFFNANFIVGSLNKLHPSLRTPFIEFLSTINYDSKKVIMASEKHPEISNYVTTMINTYADVENITPEEFDFILIHLDAFYNSDQKILAKLLNSSKHIQLMDHIDVLATKNLSMAHQQSIHELLVTCDVLENYARIIATSMRIFKHLKVMSIKEQTEELIYEKLLALSALNEDVITLLPEKTFTLIREFCEAKEVDHRLTDLTRSLESFYGDSMNCYRTDVSISENMENIDEFWLLEQINYNAFNTVNNNRALAELLFEVTSEKQLTSILTSSQFNIYHLHRLIQFSFDFMENTFKHDCMQFNPHLNYLKVPPLLKVSLLTLLEHIESLCELVSIEQFDNDGKGYLFDIQDKEKYKSIVRALICFLECLDKLEHTCLSFIDLKLVEKYFKQNLLQEDKFENLVNFGAICLLFASNSLMTLNLTRYDIEISFKCSDLILKHKWLWNVINNSDKYSKYLEIIINVLYKTIKLHFRKTNLMTKYDIENISINTSSNLDKKAAFLAKFAEIRSKRETFYDYFKLEELVTSLIVSTLRTNNFYVFAIAPIEILHFDLNISKSKLTSVPSIPIEYLNEADVLKLLIKRIHIFGYTSRHQFEEFFMSLLVLFNTEVEIEIVDKSEQYQIRNMCMTAVDELLISLKVTTNLGSTKNKFHHLPRSLPLKLDSISRNKLHKILLKLPDTNVFYLPNTEQICFESNDDITTTNKFWKNQMDLNCVWQIVEEMDEKKLNLSLRNSLQVLELSGIDFTSSFQLILDVFGQLIEVNYSLIYPHLVKMCEICENRDQYRWIKNISLRMHEIVPMINIIAHQHIIYCLCKSSAILIPSLNELMTLCSVINTYLKSTYLCIRNSTLKGLLWLLESCVKTNTTIGSLSEELSLIKNVVIHYTNNNGIVEESKLMFSDEHTKLVWALNLYLIETTSKFVNDVSIISNTVISVNNLLKRTSNINQYISILYSLQRLIVSNIDEHDFCDKIEKISLTLFKLDSEEFSIPALKLLITCLYISSNDQLQNTENSNGIVQDEPEVILQSTERIDTLFQRIKHTTSYAGEIYGNVLCQMIRDMLPPNEILTKVIKEFLTLSQPQSKVIAKILFHVFRSAIDSASLTLLQDWLICSFPNFLMFPVNRAVWCLCVIFVSASINQYLVKIFPEILENFCILNERQMILFRLFANDFYNRLNGEQRLNFKKVLSECQYEIIKNVLNVNH